MYQIRLMKTAAAGDIMKLCKMLHNPKYSVDSTDQTGTSPLLTAVRNGHFLVSCVLVNHGADWSSANHDGKTPMCEAARKGCWNIVNKFLSATKAKTENQIKLLPAALIAASAHGHLQIVRLLLQHDASVRKRDMDGCTALMRAAEGGFWEVVLLLVKHRADPSATDYEGHTALHLASANGHTAVVRCLLTTCVIDVNALDKRSRSALSYASENGHMRTVRQLLCQHDAFDLTNEVCKAARAVAKYPEIRQLLDSVLTPRLDVTEESPNRCVRYTEIPAFLHAGEFYRSLDADDNSVISVPADCFSRYDRALTLCELSSLLRAMKFWMLDCIPDGVIEYCYYHPISQWRSTAKENCDPHTTVYRDLCAVYSGASHNAFHRAIRINRVEMVEYLAAKCAGPSKYNQGTTVAARLGKLESLRALHRLGVPWDRKTCAAAAAGGHLECLQYAHEQGCAWDASTLVQGLLYGHLECAKYAFEEDCRFGTFVCEKAAQGGNWDCVEFSLQFTSRLKPSLCATAASYGHLYVLQQLHFRGAPWDEVAPARAAANGHLDCLQYLHENGCPWCEGTANDAVRAGQLVTLQYALDYDCPYDEFTIVGHAVRAGNVACLKYLLEGYYVNMSTVASAVARELSAGNLSLLECLFSMVPQHQ